MKYQFLGFIGLALLAAPLAPANARPFFKKNCGDCTTEVVQLPGQKIVVQAAKPSVVVSATHAVAAAPPPLMAAAPVVGTIFAPMALSLPGVAANGGTDSGRSAFLDRMHEANQHQLQAARHMGAAKAELEHLTKTYGAAMKGATTSCCDKPTPPPADIASITDAVNKLSQRVTDIERLVHTHDNALMAILPKVGIPPKNP